MSIWFKEFSIDDVKQLEQNNMLSHLGIELTAITENGIEGKMPVDHRTTQPMGLLHGGASCVLAESLGSIGAHLIIDHEKLYCVGLEINANHLRSATSGFVFGIAKPIHLGKTTQVWSIEIRDEKNKLVCISRLTMAVLNKKKNLIFLYKKERQFLAASLLKFALAKK